MRPIYALTAHARAVEAGLRAYTDHVTHKLKSPLTRLLGAAELLETADEQDRRALITTIHSAARRMQLQLDALRQLSAARQPVGCGPVRLSDVIATLDGALTLQVKGTL